MSTRSRSRKRRILLVPAGSRGDFQPLLALAIGLRTAGHDVAMAVSPNFVSEAAAFGVKAHAVGMDVEAFARGGTFSATSVRGAYELFKLGRRTLPEFVDAIVELGRGADLIVGSGAQLAASTAAEALGVPYAFIAFTPQVLRSDRHPPLLFPVRGLPRAVNRVLWDAFLATTARVFAGPLNRKRRALALAPVSDWYDLMCPRERSLLAADPELAHSECTALGALHLPDTRPLTPALERFLVGGDAPIYLGFGSMPDRDPHATSQLVRKAARRARVRLVLAAGWAGLSASDSDDDIHVTGPVAHALLFRRVAAVVHHGGAGTTAAALRAGRPQVVVPHVFDQFAWAHAVHAAGVGPRPIARAKLTIARLAAALRQVTRQRRYTVRAAALARKAQRRDALAALVSALEAM